MRPLFPHSTLRESGSLKFLTSHWSAFSWIWIDEIGLPKSAFAILSAEGAQDVHPTENSPKIVMDIQSVILFVVISIFPMCLKDLKLKALADYIP